jgi:hypothetical protein
MDADCFYPERSLQIGKSGAKKEALREARLSF